jgi:hypothetical protein
LPPVANRHDWDGTIYADEINYGLDVKKVAIFNTDDVD